VGADLDYDPGGEACAHGVIGGEQADPPCRGCVAEDRGDEYVRWDRDDMDTL
jgi:hypothetical protein